jgi:hypothetical protein
VLKEADLFDPFEIAGETLNGYTKEENTIAPQCLEDGFFKFARWTAVLLRLMIIEAPACTVRGIDFYGGLWAIGCWERNSPCVSISGQSACEFDSCIFCSNIIHGMVGEVFLSEHSQATLTDCHFHSKAVRHSARVVDGSHLTLV